MKYFTPNFLDFFKELAANNNKDWFDANRKRYEKTVKDPFKKFVEDLIAATRKLDPAINIEAKDAIFRINRDIRFSNDKSPYKLDRSAVISTQGRKDHSAPGFYISVGPEHTSLGGGAYFLKPEQLQAVRYYISNNSKAFEKAIADQDFVKYFGSLQGEENKRLPKEFQAAAEKQPLLFKKQFFFMKNDDPERLLEDDFLEYNISHFQAALPVHHFFKEAMG